MSERTETKQDDRRQFLKKSAVAAAAMAPYYAPASVFRRKRAEQPNYDGLHRRRQPRFSCNETVSFPMTTARLWPFVM